MEKTVRSRDENINYQSGMKSVIEYCKMTGHTDITIKELFRLTMIFSDYTMYDEDDEFKKIVSVVDKWLKEKKTTT